MLKTIFFSELKHIMLSIFAQNCKNMLFLKITKTQTYLKDMAEGDITTTTNATTTTTSNTYSIPLQCYFHYLIQIYG